MQARILLTLGVLITVSTLSHVLAERAWMREPNAHAPPPVIFVGNSALGSAVDVLALHAQLTPRRESVVLTLPGAAGARLLTVAQLDTERNRRGLILIQEQPVEWRDDDPAFAEHLRGSAPLRQLVRFFPRARTRARFENLTAGWLRAPGEFLMSLVRTLWARKPTLQPVSQARIAAEKEHSWARLSSGERRLIADRVHERRQIAGPWLYSHEIADDLMHLARSRGTRVVFVRIPIADELTALTTQTPRLEVCATLALEHPVKCWDPAQDGYAFGPEDFRDPLHLNASGRTRFTAWLATRIQLSLNRQ